MSSISAQGVVERASAELSKRINGLGLRSKHHHGSGSAGSGSGSDNTSSSSSSGSSGSGSGSSSGKTSVMERVTNALCGGGSSSNSNSNANFNSNANLNPNSNANANANCNANANPNSNSSSNCGVLTPQTPDKPSRSSPSSAPSPAAAQGVGPGSINSSSSVLPAHLMQQQQQQQQLQAMAGSTLINSNHHLVSGMPTPPAGMPLGAPPTPTVKSIAKQMNIQIPAPGSSPTFSTMGMVAAQKVSSSATGGGTPLQLRKQLPNPHLHHPAYGTAAPPVQAQAQLAAVVTQSALILHKHPPHIQSIDALLLDDRFLNRFFQYFTPYERRVLAQVCIKWRDILYRSPRYWSGLLPTLQCRELRVMPVCDRGKLYNSLIRRGFHALGLVGASDEDALDVVHSFPLASKHVHSLSLRCSSISDRGLETLLDHLQVSLRIWIAL